MRLSFTNKGDHIVIYSPQNMPDSIAVKDTGVGVDPGIIDDLFKHETKNLKNGNRRRVLETGPWPSIFATT